MELQPTTYYNQSKFSNSFYLLMIALETYISNNLLRGSIDRMIYASEGFAFRQRLNLLSQAKNQSIKELQLPFVSYFRKGNWEIDDRPAVQNATAGLFGFSEDALGGQKMRFLNVKTTFDFIGFFSTDADAQLAYETLMWIKHPKSQQFTVPGLEYLGSAISLPVILSIDSLDFNPAFTEKDWLTKNRIIPIKFSVTLRSVILSQLPQTAESSIFWENALPTITKKVILDFLSYKYQNAYYDAEHIDLELEGIFNPDPELGASCIVSSSSESTITLQWIYNTACELLYEDNIVINVNSNLNYTVAKSTLQYALTDLEPNSQYNITLYFTSITGVVTKVFVSGTTSDTGAVIGIKGLIGYAL